MSAGIRPRWEFTDAVDWITAIDEIEDDLVFAGSRDGSLFVLNRLGAEIERIPCGSWVGALKAIAVKGRHPAALRGTHLFLGTKRGLVRGMRVRDEGHDVVSVEETFSFHAGNTIRDIDVMETDEDVWIVIGSEDRHVYRVNLSDVFSPRPLQVRSVRVNGWIRSVAFAFGAVAEQPLVVAGCGDRNLYVLSERDFDSVAPTAPREVPMGAKVTSILVEPRSSKIFCISDAKELAVVTRSGSAYRVQYRTPLPHRATHLAFTDQTFGRILIACEDQHIYEYDVAQHALVSSVPVGERVCAMHGSSNMRQGRLLLGHGNGRLACCGYTSESYRERQEPPLRGDLSKLVADDFELYADALLYGPKQPGLEVGIGRFLHLTPEVEGAPRTCVVGTDEGDVVVVALEGKELAVLHREPLGHVRVWAVDSAWENPSLLRVAAATSENEIAELELDFGVTPPALVRRARMEVDDWAREIRRVEGEPEQLMICCENGELILHGGIAAPIHTRRTLRTGFAKRVNGSYAMLTGSDEGFVTRYSSTTIRWESKTLDRVREVLMHGDTCIAVSEDRFLYVWQDDDRALSNNDRGTRSDHAWRWRYRFPHRALCVDLLFDAEGRPHYVVGCGDGHVYVLEDGGAVVAAYELPDRIRDVRVVADRDLLIACEDGKLYRAPTLDAFLTTAAAGPQLVDEQLDALREPGTGADVTEFSTVERLALLADVEHWFSSPDDEIAIALIDATQADVLASRSPRWSQVLARALVHAALRVNLEAGRARIESFLRTSLSNAHAQQAMLRSIPSLDAAGPGADSAWRAMVDTIVVNLSLEDDWVREQLLTQLLENGFLSLDTDGFRQWFRRVHIDFAMLVAIVDAAARSRQPEVAGSAVVDLIAFLSEPVANVVQIAQLRARSAHGDPTVQQSLDKLQELLLSHQLEDRVPLAWVRCWAKAELSTPEAIDVVDELLDRYAPQPGDPARVYGLLADLIYERILRSRCMVSAAEYLAVHFVCGFVRTLGVRRATADGVGSFNATKP